MAGKNSESLCWVAPRSFSQGLKSNPFCREQGEAGGPLGSGWVRGACPQEHASLPVSQPGTGYNKYIFSPEPLWICWEVQPGQASARHWDVL